MGFRGREQLEAGTTATGRARTRPPEAPRQSSGQDGLSSVTAALLLNLVMAKDTLPTTSLAATSTKSRRSGSKERIATATHGNEAAADPLFSSKSSPTRMDHACTAVSSGTRSFFVCVRALPTLLPASATAQCAPTASPALPKRSVPDAAACCNIEEQYSFYVY